MSSISISNIISKSNTDYHYLIFGPQNNSWGSYLYSKNIGHYCCFYVPTTINQDNWIENEKLEKYFNSILFDPNDLMMNDCSTCGDRWSDNDVFTIETYDDVIKFFNNLDKYNNYLVIHNLEFNDSVVVNNIIHLGLTPIIESELLTDKQLKLKYDYFHNKNKFKY